MGIEFLSDAITPTSKANLLQIEMQMYLQSSAPQRFVLAALQDAAANAVASIGVENPNTDRAVSPYLQHFMVANMDASTTIKGRAGGNTAATTFLNGYAVPGRLIGGSVASFIQLNEVAA